ncbi:uncharacterized protein V6R79_008760 [Siganus canaliculatus]
MFLTLALLRKGIPGKQWIGKYRRPRQITWQMKRNTLKHLEREAENEYWISRPYMTQEQERGHAAELKQAVALEQGSVEKQLHGSLTALQLRL